MSYCKFTPENNYQQIVRLKGVTFMCMLIKRVLNFY